MPPKLRCEDLLTKMEMTITKIADDVLSKKSKQAQNKTKKGGVLILKNSLKALYKLDEQRCLEYILSKFYAGKPRPFKDAYSSFMLMMKENDLDDTTYFIADEIITGDLVKRTRGEFQSWFGSGRKGRTPESGFYTGPGQKNLMRNAESLPESLKGRLFPRCEEILGMLRRIMNSPGLDYCATKEQFLERFSQFRYRQETIQLENILVEIFRDRICLETLLNGNQAFRQAFRQYHRGQRINGLRDMLWELYRTPGFGPSGPSAWETAFDDF